MSEPLALASGVAAVEHVASQVLVGNWDEDSARFMFAERVVAEVARLWEALIFSENQTLASAATTRSANTNSPSLSPQHPSLAPTAHYLRLAPTAHSLSNLSRALPHSLVPKLWLGNARVLQLLLLLLNVALQLVISPSYALAQTQPNAPADGFNRLSGRHVEIVTDLPLTDDLQQLPSVFDAAVEQWCEIFKVPVSSAATWHVTAHLMGARERFVAAGMLPKTLPNFLHGFQLGNDLWVVEQPSAYYRRHLLLHEGTHWFMVRKYGNAGPPWIMEGTAEWLATHRWDGSQLTLGIIPNANTEVPFWGRITLIQDQLNSGVAPSLENILRYGYTAHLEVDAYAWSWAAVLFMQHHPDTRRAFEEIFDGELKSDTTVTRGLFTHLRARWPAIRQEWLAALTDLEYGYDPTRGLPTLTAHPEALSQAKEVTISAAAGWQATAITVTANQKLEIAASGQYTIGTDPKPWICEPQGVTIGYYRHQPLGKLIMAILAPISKEPSLSDPIRTFPIGALAEIRCPHSGELFFRVNESIGSLADNSGELRIEIVPK